jgi:Leucine-rich repeat (LRR) protein
VDTTLTQGLQTVGEILVNLKELKLSNSNIPSLSDLGNSFSNLKILWVAKCSLRSLDGLIFFESLQELYAQFNFIEDIIDVSYIS